MKERHKIQLALKFFKGKLTEYQSGEAKGAFQYIYTLYCQRHMYIFSFGEGPWACTIQSILFSVNMQIMKHMHTPDDVDEDVYIRHMALSVSVKVYFKDCNVQLPHSFNRESLQDYQILIKVHHTKFSGSG